MLLRFAIPRCFVVGLAAVVCLGVGCEDDSSSPSGAPDAPGTSPPTTANNSLKHFRRP